MQVDVSDDGLTAFIKSVTSRLFSPSTVKCLQIYKQLTAQAVFCFLHSEILNISTSPHEFKMDSHISVAFPKAVSRKGTVNGSLLEPDSVDVCVSCSSVLEH